MEPTTSTAGAPDPARENAVHARRRTSRRHQADGVLMIERARWTGVLLLLKRLLIR